MATTQKIKFQNQAGLSLDAKLDLPDQTPLAYALLAHCFACSKDLIAEARISRALTDHGIAVFRFDFTGLGKSEGEFVETNFSSNIDDILDAVSYLRENHQAPKLLIGHSLGGTAVLGAAPKVEEVVAVATIASPSDPAHITERFKNKLPEIKTKGDVVVNLGGGPIHISRQFIEDVNKQSILESLPLMHKALLIFHSPVDAIVNIENARKIYDAAKHPKSFISLDHANHLLTDKRDAIYVADVLAAWASRYVNLHAEEQSAVKSEPGTVIVTETGQGKFTQQVVSGNHFLTADEPIEYGGNDTGLSPYEFLLAGLGACTSMTLRLYAERKQIPLEKTSITLSHKKIHAKDCEDCETKDGMLDHIESKLHLEGQLTEEQKQRLLEIANKCPVHKTLTSEIKIDTELE